MFTRTKRQISNNVTVPKKQQRNLQSCCVPFTVCVVYVCGVRTSTICVCGACTFTIFVCLCMCVVYVHLPYVWVCLRMCVVYAQLPYVCVCVCTFTICVWCMYIYHMCLFVYVCGVCTSTICVWCMCSAIFLASSFPTFAAPSETQPIKIRPTTYVLALVKCRRPSC